MARTIAFKFKWVDGSLQPRGSVFSKKGTFDDRELVLDGVALPSSAILRSTERFGCVILETLTSHGFTTTTAFSVSSRNGRALRLAINQVAAGNWARARRALLAERGGDVRFTSVPCPYCDCEVEVTGHPRTPQLHCPYCDAISSFGDSETKEDAHYRLCPLCDRYSRPVEYSDFQFWYAVVAHGFRHRLVESCRLCMRKTAWAMLAKNLVFLLGVPTALIQLVRAYSGDAVTARRFAGLTSANAAARDRKKMDLAVKRYRAIEERLEQAAGVRYNRGMVLRRGRRLEEAADAFRQALADCANYRPAYEALCRIYRRTRDDERLVALLREWDGERDAASPRSAPASVQHRKLGP